jgi:hypothetical protein
LVLPQFTSMSADLNAETLVPPPPSIIRLFCQLPTVPVSCIFLPPPVMRGTVLLRFHIAYRVIVQLVPPSERGGGFCTDRGGKTVGKGGIEGDTGEGERNTIVTQQEIRARGSENAAMNMTSVCVL